MKIESVKISEIKPYQKNAKKHPKSQVEKIAASIKEFGFKQPIVIDKQNVLIVGHGRVEGAKLLGLQEVPAIIADDLTPDQIKAYRLADNKLNESDWDMDLVIQELKGLEEFMIDLTGFSKDLILEPDEKDDQVPELPEEPKAKLGEIYQLGKHRLMCGDSTKLEDVEKLMNGQKASMVFTDPPYNVDYKGGTGLTIKNDKFKNKQDFYQFLFDAISAFRAFIVGDIYIAMSSSELHTLQKAFQDCGGHWSTFIIWVKDRFTLGRSNYQRQYEPILYGWFEGSSHYWSGARNLGDVVKEEIKEEIDGSKWLKIDQIQTDVWEVKKPDKNKVHQTMKPVSLMERAIINSSMPDQIVLDTFLGSGSTLIACEKTNRICYGMELDPRYIDVIIKRWEDYTGQKAELLSNNSNIAA
jgi:DNA modification methylase